MADMSTDYNLNGDAMEFTESVVTESSNVFFAVESCAASQEWSSTLSPIRIQPFTSTTGPAFMVVWDPSDVFTHLFDDSILEYIVEQSNLYAQQTMDAAKYNAWQLITLEELKAYLGFNVLMGLVRLPEIEDYWKQDPFFHYAPIADRIPRDRFRDISRYLHFCDNSTLAKRGEQGYDRLGKVRPVINAINASVKNNYQPSRDIVVDEAMIPFQGESCLKQFLPKKPVKRGIKVWCLADSTNGYVHNFDVYTGKGSQSSEGTLGSRVVLMLSDHLQHKNHHLYCDNYFTSPSLFKELLERGTYACGTVRQNSKCFPSDLKVSGKGKNAGAKLGLVDRGDTAVR